MVTFIRKPFPENKILFLLIQQRRDLVMAVMVNPLVQPAAVAVNVAVVEDDEVSDLSTTVSLNQAVNDDSEAADIVFGAISHKLKFSKGNYFYKQDANVWVSSKLEVEGKLKYFILFKTDLYKLDAKGNKKPYSRNVSGANNILTALMSKIIVDAEDDMFYEKFVTTTKGRICFLDGVLDFREKTGDNQGRFYTWDEINGRPEIPGVPASEGVEEVPAVPAVEPAFEYYTPVQIKRTFKDFFDNPDEDAIESVRTCVFEPLYGADYINALKFYSRGLAGHFEDKAWSQYISNRDAGKSVISDGIKLAVGPYSGTVDNTNLLCNSNKSLKQEKGEKQMEFALGFQFCRFVICQEMPAPPKGKTIKLNGEMIKKLCSGGDPLTAKKNYDIYFTEFINQARLLIFCNDSPEATNDDVFETCVEFSGVNVFKSQAEIDAGFASGEDPLVLQTWRLADPDIKTVKIRQVSWCNAMIMLLLRNYSDTKVVPNVDLSAEEMAQKKELSNKSLRKFILEYFILTNDETKFVSNEDIQNVFDEEQFGDVSAKKMAIEFKALTRTAGRKGGKRGWFKLEIKPRIVDPNA